jgi:Ca-activated chloride channel family protein
LNFEGGDMTGGELGADEIVFDNKAGSSEQTEEVAGNEPLSNQEIQALWLRRVQTKPADFLKAKFAFQQAQRGESQ